MMTVRAATIAALAAPLLAASVSCCMASESPGSGKGGSFVVGDAAGLAATAADARPGDDECLASEEGEVGCGLSLRQLRGELRAGGGILDGGRGGASSRELSERGEDSGAGVAEDEPIAWCTSGGGWRAMVSAIGFANAFDKAGLFKSGHLTDVAGNSGGSWFLAQFAYNAEFFSNTTSDDAETLHAWVRTLMHAYSTFTGPATSFGTKENTILNTIGSFSKSGTKIDEVLTAAKWYLTAEKPDWQQVIDKMLATTPGLSTPDLYKKTMANQASRAGLRGPTLHFQIAEVTTSYFPWTAFGFSLGYERAFLLDHDKKPLAYNQSGDDSNMPVVPLQYVVRGAEGQDSGLKEGLQHPESALYRYSVGFLGLESTAGGELEDVQATPPLQQELSVLTVASASSAAAGLLSSPLMLREVVGDEVGATAWTGIKYLLPGEFNGAGVCSQPAVGEEECPYPSRRFIDGGYVDDMATSQTVALMQQKFGTGTPMRLVLTDSEQYSPGGAAFEPVNLKYLMQGGHATGPGLLVKGLWLAPSQQIFDVAYDSLQWVDLSSEFDDTQGMKYATASGATVDNPAYGVKAGTPVKLLIFAYHSKLAALGDGLEEEYATVSSSIAKSSVRSVAEAWLRGEK